MRCFSRLSLATVLAAGAVYAADIPKEPARKVSLGMYLDMVNISDPQISFNALHPPNSESP